MSEPWWSPSEYAARRPILRVRSDVIAAIRSYFADQGFIEVETAALQKSPGIDRHIQPLKTSIRGAFETNAVERFLHTSPEFSMKKLLAAGEDKIFQICHVYRDGESGTLHHPEFTMLEWYRAGETYEALIEDVAAVVSQSAAAAKALELRHGERAVDVGQTWTVMTVAQAFQTFAGIDVLAQVDDPLTASAVPFIEVVRAAGIRCDDADRWDDVFSRVMLERVEPALAEGPPTMLKDFPSPVGALARQSPEDPRVCERVEAYVCGVELANGFSELTDPVEQRARFERDAADYRELYGEGAPIDEGFLDALALMPDAAGMALGLDRLVMLLTGAAHIRDVLWAPVDVRS